MISRIFGLLAIVGALFLTSCEPPAQLRVEKAYIIMSPIADRPAAAYFTVYGGPQPVELLEVVAPQALRTVMHDNVPVDGLMTMAQITKVPIPARGEVTFEPGGKHAMLFGVDNSGRNSGELRLEFIFSNGDRILVDAPVRNMGSANAGHQAQDS
ncbi:MAG: copper chaperone PCu(A)C [Blastomonas sp.]